MDYDDLLDYIALQILGQFDPNLEGEKQRLHTTLNDQIYNEKKTENWEEPNEKQELSKWDATMRMVDAVRLSSYRLFLVPAYHPFLVS